MWSLRTRWNLFDSKQFPLTLRDTHSAATLPPRTRPVNTRGLINPLYFWSRMGFWGFVIHMVWNTRTRGPLFCLSPPSHPTPSFHLPLVKQPDGCFHTDFSLLKKKVRFYNWHGIVLVVSDVKVNNNWYLDIERNVHTINPVSMHHHTQLQEVFSWMKNVFKIHLVEEREREN